MSTSFMPAQVFPYAAPYAARGFQAGVIQPDGSPFIVGSFLHYEFALNAAKEYALDLMHIAHARANRPLKLAELRDMSDADLLLRKRFLNCMLADHMTKAQRHAQANLITRVQNERRILSGAEVDGSDAQDPHGGEVVR